MALDSVRIKVSVDDSTLQPFIDKLDDVGRKDDENTRKAAKNAQLVEQYQKKIQEALAKTGISLESIGKANIAAFSLDELKAFYQQLTKIKEETDKVGNSSTSTAQKFNTLQYSINNITREMPAFANSVQTGFMAISNNIPAVIDEVTKLRKANVELAASGQPTNSVFKTLLGSIFSWGTALSVGVTLLTLYGKELVNFISGFFSASEAIDMSEKALEEYNKLLNESVNATNDYVKARNANVQEILVGEGKITDAQSASLKAYEDYQSNLEKAEGRYASARKIALQEFKFEEDQKGQLVNKGYFNLEARRKALFAKEEELGKLLVEERKTALELLETENEKIGRLELNRLEKENEEKKKKGKKAKDEQAKLYEEALREFERISSKTLSESERDYKERLKRETDARTNAQKVEILKTEEGTQERLNAEIRVLEEESKIKLLNAHLTEDERFIIIKETENKIKDLREKYQKDQIKALEEDLKRREELADQELKALEDAEKKKLEIRNAGIQAALDVAGNVSNAIFTIENQNATDRYNRRLKQLEEEKNAELNSKTLTEKQKIAIQERFDQETEQLQKQEFERQKNFKIAQAIINTALAVTNALATGVPPFNVIQAIAIGAQGAAQIAIIENEKFAKGGLVGGKLHSQGGTVIEAEKDEYVINRKDTMENLELIESINKGKGDEYIYKKYVLPAVIGQKEAKAKESGLFAGIMDNMALNGKMFDDYYLRKAIEKSGKENAIMIVKGLKENTTLKNTRQF